MVLACRDFGLGMQEREKHTERMNKREEEGRRAGCPEKTQKDTSSTKEIPYFAIFFIRCHYRANHRNLRAKVGHGKVW